jgi:hypothetical protein
MTKTAMDILYGDITQILNRAGEVIILDYIEDKSSSERVHVKGYREHDGEDFEAVLDYDSKIRVA